MDANLIIIPGNYDDNGFLIGKISKDDMNTDMISIFICDHENRNEHEDYCHDCKAIRIDGEWL